MGLLFADGLPDFQVPGWVQVIGYLITIAVMPVLTLWLKSLAERRKEEAQERASSDIAHFKLQHEAESDERRIKNDEWVKLLEERRKVYDRDMKRMETALQKLHDRTTHLERQEEQCQETVQTMQAEIVELKRTTGNSPGI